MKLTFPVLLLMILFISPAALAQFCIDGDRFSQKEVFARNQIAEVKDITYGQAINCKNQNEALRLDIYAPDKNTDILEKRPLVLMMHGGGFVSGERTNLTNDCIALARRGYVTVTMSYRLGWNNGSYLCFNSANTQTHAAYRAMQDLHAALRFMIANADKYGIDTNWIFIGGSSAGAVATLNLAFGTQEEFDARVPALRNSLGLLNNSGNTLKDNFTVKGVFNNWGALFDINMIQPEDRIPVIAFHGDQDGTVPIDFASRGGTSLYGSRLVHRRLDSLGICSDLTVKPGGGHGVYNTGRAQSDFRMNRASCFFRQIFCNNCTSFYSTDSISPECNSLVTDISQPLTELTVRIFPNPVKDILNINGLSTEQWSLELLNVHGQVLFYEENQHQLDIRSLNSGVYFLHIRAGEKRTVHQFVKE